LKRVGLGLVLVAAALLAYFLLRGDDEVSAESKYDGVHLCAPSQQEAATVAAGKSGNTIPTPSGNLDLEPSRTKGPLFAQNASAWGGEEYDAASKQDVGCGQTLAQCGCAMTSVATILALFQMMTTPDGKELNPSSLNSWFNEGAVFTGSGWVSHGYSYGNVVWTAVNNFSSNAQPGNGGKSVRFAGWGSGSEEEIKGQLAKGNAVSVEVPGHYVAAVGIQGDEILINDPAYAERTTLSAYKGLVKSSRLFEPSDDLSGIMISVPANQRVKVTDSQGREVGTLGGKKPQDAEKDAKTEIPGAMYHFEEAWRDPTCTEKPPEEGQGVNSIFLPNPQSGNYTVEVLGEKSTSAVVYLYDKTGALRMIQRGGADKLQFDFTFGSGGGGGGTPPTPTSTGTVTPTPTPTPTLAPGVSPEASVEPNEAVSPVPPGVITPTFTPTNTATPTPTPTSTQTPSLNIIQSFTSELSALGMQGQTCSTKLSWNVTGDPNSTVVLLRNGQPIFNSPMGANTYTEPFLAGAKSYILRATNSGGVIANSQALNVNPWCLVTYEVNEVDTCNDSCWERRHTWTIQGSGVTGTLQIRQSTAVNSCSPFGGWAPIHNQGLSPSTFDDNTSISFSTMNQLFVTVNGVTVTSPVRTTVGEACIG